MSERIDWTTTEGCERCNEHGPYEEWDAKVIASNERSRDAHQAWHGIAEAVAPPFVRVLNWMDRRLTR